MRARPEGITSRPKRLRHGLSRDSPFSQQVPMRLSTVKQVAEMLDMSLANAYNHNYEDQKVRLPHHTHYSHHAVYAMLLPDNRSHPQTTVQPPEEIPRPKKK